MAMKDAMLTAVSQKERNAAKSMSLVGLLPCMIQALYSSAKRPVQWMTQMPMSTMSLSGMGCLARLAYVAPWNRHATRSSKPCEGCHSKAMSVRLASRSSADVQPYFATNQANISQKTEFGFSIRICSQDCLKATGTRSRKASIRAEFMLMTSLCRLSAMPWVTLTLARSLVLMHPL